MIHKMRYWVILPRLLISGNKALSYTLEKLHTRNYNILLAHPDGLSTHLAGIASCVWDFECLLRGESPYRVRKEMVPSMLVERRCCAGTF
ncbi:hypothetical protein OROHE_007672 [Orobanche hederae]